MGLSALRGPLCDPNLYKVWNPLTSHFVYQYFTHCYYFATFCTHSTWTLIVAKKKGDDQRDQFHRGGQSTFVCQQEPQFENDAEK